MKIAFLNLCHTDPRLVARAAKKLTCHPDFDMYVHVDAKSDIQPFRKELDGIGRVFLLERRHKVYWGGFNAIMATIELLRAALASPRMYDYYVILQNLDYPTRSNDYIRDLFESRKGTQFMRACNIARTKDWHFSQKYKIYNQRDDDYYLKEHHILRKYMRYAHMLSKSFRLLFSDGVIREQDRKYDLYYGAAQWAITRECAEYMADFYERHPKFNDIMRHVQFPDEEYFHTILHNSDFKYQCIQYDEPEKRWLSNWRNLHYFEYPYKITLMEEKDYDKIMDQDVLFVRKVCTGFSDGLMDKIDKATGSS